MTLAVTRVILPFSRVTDTVSVNGWIPFVFGERIETVADKADKNFLRNPSGESKDETRVEKRSEEGSITTTRRAEPSRAELSRAAPRRAAVRRVGLK